MPSDTLLSKLLSESPTAIADKDRPVLATAGTDVLLLCGFVVDAAVCTLVMLSVLSLWGVRLYSPHTDINFSAIVGLCAALLLQSDHHRLPADEAKPILYTAAAIRLTFQTLLILLPASVLLHSVLARGPTLLALLGMPIALTLERHVMDVVWIRFRFTRASIKRVVILGPLAAGRRIASTLFSSPHLGLKPTALIDDRPRRSDEYQQWDYRGLPILNVTPTAGILRSLQCDLLVIAPSAADIPLGDEVVLAAREAGAQVSQLLTTDWQDTIHETNDRTNTLFFAEADVTWYFRPLKRALDVFISSLCLIILSPALLVIAIMIRTDSSGPAIFIQERIGRGGTRFSMYKFRSMACSAQPYEYSPISPDDPRITTIGRFLRRTSLDELPQLLNVLLGQMSLVGPRPEMPFITSQYDPHQRLRLQLIPGITGLWQLSKDRVYPIHENMHHDLLYIRTQSISLDIAILIHTFFFAMRGGV